MKKAITLILATILVFSLAACGSQPAQPSNPAATQAPAATKAPAATNAPAASGEETPAPAKTTSGTIGYITDEVDHYARDPYKFVYVYNSPTNLTNYMFQCMTNLGTILNFEITESSSNGDVNLYISTLETVILTEPDGIVFQCDYEIMDRAVEVLDESGIPYLSLFNSVLDDNGNEFRPVVMMNQYLNGGKQCEYLASVYKDYWGDIDTSKLGQIVLTWSLNNDLITRQVGAQDKFKELFPDNADLMFTADAVSVGKMNADSAYNLAYGIISAHPEIEYWFINSVVEDMSPGAARATEALGKDDRTLITGSGSSVLPDEWRSGYVGNWVANFAVSNYEYAVPAVCGLIAMADGRTTMEDLWSDLKRPGDTCAQFVVGTDMITHDNFEAFFKSIEESFGLHFN